ncbi:MAG: VWA domain-containing protein [Verrucomicrobiales bacterium]
MKTLTICAALLFTACAAFGQATLKAPDEAGIGSEVEVSWTGPGNNYDSVYVIGKDEPDEAGGPSSAKILSKKNPLTVVMPDEPGVYELRYWDRGEKKVAARRDIKVVDVPASLDVPATAGAGEQIEVKWEGPGNNYDQIAIYDGSGDDAKALFSAGILSKKNPIPLKLPEKPGDYEIRYQTRQSKRILAREKIKVEGIETTLDAPEKAPIGSPLEVAWKGPGNNYDQINLYKAGAPDDAPALVGIGILSKKNPILLPRLPDEPGDYELRYVTSQSKLVLARRPLKIVAEEAAIMAPERATAAMQLMVGWEGPGNDYDQIALFAKGAAADAKPVRASQILSKRNPLPLNLPDEEGEFELRYLTAQTGKVLATKPIALEPAGKLRVVFEREREIKGGAAGAGGIGAVELILDASGSMLKREAGKRRIDIAKSVLDELAREHLADDCHFALRVFGHKEPNKCRTDLEIPLGKLDRAAAVKRIASIEAMNLAKTPIADSLAQVPSDLSGAKGPKTIVLITDGEETCDGDPAKVIAGLRADGLDIQVSIVGFAIDDADLKSDFEQWAELGGGSYFDARSAEELAKSIRSVISGPYRVLDQDGNVAATGVIGGAPVVLPAGTYRLETVGGTPLVIEDVAIKPRELTEAAF